MSPNQIIMNFIKFFKLLILDYFDFYCNKLVHKIKTIFIFDCYCNRLKRQSINTQLNFKCILKYIILFMYLKN